MLCQTRIISFLLVLPLWSYQSFLPSPPLPIASRFVGPRRIFVRLTTVTTFLYAMKCKLGSGSATQTFYDRKVTQLSGELLSRGCDVTMTSGSRRMSLHVLPQYRCGGR